MKHSKISSFIAVRYGLFLKTKCSQFLMKKSLVLGGLPRNALATGQRF